MIKKKGPTRKLALQRIAHLEGLMDQGLLVGRPESIKAMAAKVAHEVNKAYCSAIGDDMQSTWDDAPKTIKDCLLSGVELIAQEIVNSPSVSHAFWCRYKKEEGWVYGEAKDIEKKIHPCLVPYSDLPPEQKIKDHLFFASVCAVIGRTPAKEQPHE